MGHIYRAQGLGSMPSTIAVIGGHRFEHAYSLTVSYLAKTYKALKK